MGNLKSNTHSYCVLNKKQPYFSISDSRFVGRSLSRAKINRAFTPQVSATLSVYETFNLGVKYRQSDGFADPKSSESLAAFIANKRRDSSTIEFEPLANNHRKMLLTNPSTNQNTEFKLRRLF